MTPTVLIDPGRTDAVVFDLDGVLTDTARIHAAVWKQTFDAFLADRAQATGGPFVPFDLGRDYLQYVDGRPRQAGVRTFLAARGILLPEGSPGDPPDAATVEGLATRKNQAVAGRLATESQAEPGAADLMRDLRRAGVKVAVASSSANCAAVLQAAGLADLVDVRVDGVDIAQGGMPGKPDPALFLEALHRLGVAPDRAVMVEDALAGVEAGRRGGFATVVGVGQGPHGEALRAHGADVVVPSVAAMAVGIP